MNLYWVTFVLTVDMLSANGFPTNETNGFGYELLLAKMDFLEYKFLELQVEIREQSETILHNQDKNKRLVIEQTSEILEQQKMAVNHEKLKESIFELRPRKHPSDNSKFIMCLKQNKWSEIRSSFDSCESEASMKSGTRMLSLDQSNNVEVYCEQTLHEGGWIVIQKRFDGSVDFYRNWTDYKNGFGDLNGEFWLGLDKIHALTKSRSRVLLIQVEDFAGNTYHAKYGAFEIGGEDEKYILKPSLVYLNGTMGDSLSEQKGQKFTTIDSDNDNYATNNCAIMYRGGWWYNKCYYSNLNGLHKDAVDSTAMVWYTLKNNHSGLKSSKMMIK